MKKIFILTGEPSGDKLASTVISKLQSTNPEIKYLSVGGVNLKKLGISSIYDLKDITYLGFTSVIFNIFKIRSKINKTVEKIIKFNPDILFSTTTTVTNMVLVSMSRSCLKGELGGWDTSNVTNMKKIFSNSHKLIKLRRRYAYSSYPYKQYK